MKATIKTKMLVKNASWIIACKIVQALLNMGITMLSARFLGPSGYGLINYAASIVAFVAPVMYLGLNSVMVQMIVNDPEQEGQTVGTAMLMCFFSSFLCIAGVVAFTMLANRGETETLIVCALYSVLLIFQALELIVYWFQAKLLSKYSSVISLVSYIIVSACKLYLLAADKSIYWFAISSSLDYCLIFVMSLVAYKRLGGQKLSFSWQRFRRMFAVSKYYILANMMVTIFAQTDRIMIKLMIDDAATGYYSAAVTCAGMTGFVFTAIIDSFRPMIFEDKKRDDAHYEQDLIHLYGIVIYASLLQSVVISAFSGLIIRILYGVAYASASSALRIVVWYTTFSYLGAVRNIWILAEGKQRYLWVINLAGALANVVLNFVLIPFIGIEGAALASLITQIFTNVIVGFVLKPIRHNNRLMLRALNPRVLIGLVKGILKKRTV